MELTTENLNNHFKSEEGCTLLKEFIDNKSAFAGRIRMTDEGYELEFDVSILPYYPFQFFETEAITFSNEDLIDYGHVGIDGLICIHTTHSPDLTIKLIKDVASLREWISIYFLGKKEDTHYEHLKLPSNSIKTKEVLLFTDVEHTFKVDDSGHFYFSVLKQNKAFEEYDKNVNTYLLQHFEYNKKVIPCKWSNAYNKNDSLIIGFFVFLKRQPTWAKHFAYETWDEFQEIVPKALLDYFNDLKQQKKAGNLKGEYFPLLVGYNIPNEDRTKEVPHWQLINIPSLDIPISGIKDKDGNWIGMLTEKKIIWHDTKNCSYQYFFGRGKMTDKITNAKVLIIGVGAIGSAVAVTLARCGVKSMGFIDYDTKEPGNVCRSEYFFSTGITTKLEELSELISSISPFVNIVLKLKKWGVVKSTDTEIVKAFKEILDKFDIIFDCSTDNDVSYILDKISPQARIINLSITNHAKDLVCAISPNSYSSMMNIFKHLQNDTQDMYNPTGCWSPTFKASYNDINLLVQYALKHLNQMVELKRELRSFYLSTSLENEFIIKLNQI